MLLYLFLFQALESFLVSAFFGVAKSFITVTCPLNLTRTYCQLKNTKKLLAREQCGIIVWYGMLFYLSSPFLDPLISLAEILFKGKATMFQ